MIIKTDEEIEKEIRSDKRARILRVISVSGIVIPLFIILIPEPLAVFLSAIFIVAVIVSIVNIIQGRYTEHLLKNHNLEEMMNGLDEENLNLLKYYSKKLKEANRSMAITNEEFDYIQSRMRAKKMKIKKNHRIKIEEDPIDARRYIIKV